MQKLFDFLEAISGKALVVGASFGIVTAMLTYNPGWLIAAILMLILKRMDEDDGQED